MPSSTASVSGSASVNVVPWPGVERDRMRPPSAWMLRRTTSMPTPRPEMSETCLGGGEARQEDQVVDLLVGQRLRRPRSGPSLDAPSGTHALAVDAAPSSAISMTMRPPDGRPTAHGALGRLAGARRARPASRCRGRSRCGSCASADRRAARSRSCRPRCPRRRMTRRTFLPVCAASSRTRRGMRWNTDLTGCARIAMTLSCRLRVVLRQLLDARDEAAELVGRERRPCARSAWPG